MLHTYYSQIYSIWNIIKLKLCNQGECSVEKLGIDPRACIE